MSQTRRITPLTADRMRSAQDLVGQAIEINRWLTAGRRPWLADQGLVESVLPFANREVTAVEKFLVDTHLAPGASLSFCLGDDQRERLEELLVGRKGSVRSKEDKELLELLEDWWGRSTKARHAFRQRVALVCDDPEAALRELGDEFKGSLDRIHAPTRLHWDGRRLHVETSFTSLDGEAVLNYVLMLLLDESRGLGALLRKCRLESCGNYFLTHSSPGGGPMPVYCCAEHRMIAASLTGADRTKRYRDRLRDRSKPTKKGKQK